VIFRRSHDGVPVNHEVPLHFGGDAGAFAPFAAATRDSQAIAAAFGEGHGEPNIVSIAAAPYAFELGRMYV
jgi:hypothetical protein